MRIIGYLDTQGYKTTVFKNNDKYIKGSYKLLIILPLYSIDKTFNITWTIAINIKTKNKKM